MNEYTVAPNRDGSKWIVKIEDVAPEDTHDQKDAAIAQAEELAAQNKPSKVIILDANHEQVEERKFN